MRYRMAMVGAGAVAAALVVAAYVFGNAGAGTAAPQAAAPFAMPVPVSRVIKRTIPLYLNYSARTESIRGITLQAKVTGFVQEQTVPDGADVTQGELLYRIDPRDFQAVLDQATAQAQRDLAQLDYAIANARRGSELTKGGCLAQDSEEQRTSTMRQAAASLAVDRAVMRTAQLNLDYAQIRAPFSGRLGRNQAPVGTLVSTAGTALNTLVQLDPIYVTFNPSETDLPAIQKARAAGRVKADIFLPGEDKPSHEGELTFVDNSVDQATGTITARATIDNADRTLLPGQYVKVRLHAGDQPNALLVAQTAVGSGQLGKYLYVVGDGDRVEQRFVTLGATDADLVSVLSGIGEKDQVIVGNLQKIGPGAPVRPLMSAPH